MLRVQYTPGGRRTVLYHQAPSDPERFRLQYDPRMDPVGWPLQKEDGSVSVGVQFSLLDPGATESVRATVASYVDEKVSNGVDLLEDLWQRPHVVVEESGHLQVIFDGRPDSKWKDWMVECIRRLLDSSFGLIEMEGSYDRVAGVLRRTPSLGDRIG